MCEWLREIPTGTRSSTYWFRPPRACRRQLARVAVRSPRAPLALLAAPCAVAGLHPHPGSGQFSFQPTGLINENDADTSPAVVARQLTGRGSDSAAWSRVGESAGRRRRSGRVGRRHRWSNPSRDACTQSEQKLSTARAPFLQQGAQKAARVRD
eukprot:SAG11_NODE_538_length_8664_cov_5.830590_4_plen_154_part_00